MIKTARQKIVSKVNALRSLPALPAVTMQLIEIVNSSTSSVDEVAQLVERDPGLTSTLLRYANSAFYGRPRSISSVSAAVVILGFNTIRSVALTNAMFAAFRPIQDSVFNRDNFWIHCFACGCAARKIAQLIPVDCDIETAFCAGIIHDVGRLLFEQIIPDEFKQAIEESKEHIIPLISAEERLLGITHAEIGPILADHWGLPFELERAITLHHTPPEANVKPEIAEIIFCADCCAHDCKKSLWQGQEHGFTTKEVCDRIQITEQSYKTVCEYVDESLVSTADLFGIKIE